MFFQGFSHTQIRYNDSSKVWVMTHALKPGLRAESKASKVSYVLGKHEWTVTGEVYECHGGQPYTTFLKLSGCSMGDFTCDSGQCVRIEQRCDQLPNCRDESDERGCQLLLVKDGYNKNVPPITSVSDTNMTLVAAPVHISISLLKIVSMEEVQHKIDFQFGIILKWKENRVNYNNLKTETSLNALTEDNIRKLWLPYVVYANTDMKEAVQLQDGVVDTTVVVSKEGNFIYSGGSVIDEMQSFEGKDNTLAMYQTYTKSFQCLYKLQKYPFDTQVRNQSGVEMLINSFYILQVCSIEMTTRMLDLQTVELLAGQMWMNETKDLTLFVIKNWTLSTIENEGVKMTIVLKRKIMNEMMTTYLPSVLLMLITYATTFFKPYFFEAALSVNLTTMLVMTTIFMTVMQMLPATAYVKMIDIFLIFGQLYPFSEVVLLTLMEYKREGDGSGMDNGEDEEKETESRKAPEDKLYWYKFTGEISFIIKIHLTLSFYRTENSSQLSSCFLRWIYCNGLCLLH